MQRKERQTAQALDYPLNLDKFAEYAGQWVAVLNDEVIAADTDLMEVAAAVERLGLKPARPVVFMVPRKDERFIVI